MKNKKICVIGLGYVGLPLALAFGRKYKTIGFDLSSNRVDSLSDFIDKNNQHSKEEIKKSKYISFTNHVENIKDCNIYIICVPTPIDRNNNPDLKPLETSSMLVSSILKKGDIVIYESTTYPSCTEDFCVPILSGYSELFYNKDFFVGYSPERINPSDKVNTLENTIKVTSGSTPRVATIVDNLYKSIIPAGTHKASSIKVAEASKVVENIQRDVNIALMNELSIIFKSLKIDTKDVIDASATKWNFLKFNSGLVGGHCISVDPYYLIKKAKSVGVNPKIIQSSRDVNEFMSKFISDDIIKLMNEKGLYNKSKVLILGVTYKPNISDIRNSKVIDLYEHLSSKVNVTISDPYADKLHLLRKHVIKLTDFDKLKKYDAVILAVGHKDYLKIDLRKYLKNNKSILYDINGVLKKDKIDSRL